MQSKEKNIGTNVHHHIPLLVDEGGEKGNASNTIASMRWHHPEVLRPPSSKTKFTGLPRRRQLETPARRTFPADTPNSGEHMFAVIVEVSCLLYPEHAYSRVLID